MKQTKHLQSIASILQGFAVALVVFGLYAGKDIFIPLALGILFAFLLAPVVNRLQRVGLSNLTAVITTAAAVFGVLSVLGWILWTGVAGLVNDLPQYKDEMKSKVASIHSYSKNIGKVVNEIEEMSSGPPEEDESGKSDANARESSSNEQPKDSSNATESPTGSDDQQSPAQRGQTGERPLYVTEVPSTDVMVRNWAGGLGVVFGPMGTIGLVVVFALFLLIYRDDLRDRFVAVISRGNYVVTTDALQEAADRVGSYLMAQLIVNLSYSIVFGLGLAAVGYFFAPDGEFPNALVLGLFAGLLRFIPYLGPLIAAALPTLTAFALIPGYNAVVAVVVLILIMELTLNNVIEPLVYGSSTGVSAIAVIIAAVFWGWLWGPVGLLLATPLTTCLVVLGRYVPRFRFFATLLSDQQQVDASIRAYQRLLAGNEYKLKEFIEQEFEDKPTDEFVDEVVVPTLKHILRDDTPRELSQCQLTSQFVTQVQHVVGQRAESVIKDRSHEQAESVEPVLRPTCFAIAATNSAEVALLTLMQQQLADRWDFRIVDPDDVPDRIAAEIAVAAPAVVTVMAIPGMGFRQAKFWCRSIRSHGYQGSIHTICPGRFRKYDQLFTAFRKAGSTTVMTSIEQAIRRLNREHARALQLTHN